MKSFATVYLPVHLHNARQWTSLATYLHNAPVLALDFPVDSSFVNDFSSLMSHFHCPHANELAGNREEKKGMANTLFE